MKKDTIYNLATNCKNISDSEIKITKFINSTSISRLVTGNISLFEKALEELCEAIREKYPTIHSDLKKHMDEYDSNRLLHQGAIDATLDCLIAIETPGAQSTGVKKIFISHSFNDSTIVNAFVKEILMLGCGFKPNDIFCTLDHTAIRTGDDFRNEIIANMKCCDFILCFISENYRKSEVCQNEMGAAWSLEGKRVIPFKFPNLSFNEIGFLNVVKQAADITDKAKLDELYKELCEFYNIKQEWISFNQRTTDFFKTVNENQ